MSQRENVQRAICQHCISLQKANDTAVECWYNPLTEEGQAAFCGHNEDAATAILIAVGCDPTRRPLFDWDLIALTVLFDAAKTAETQAGFAHVLAETAKATGLSEGKLREQIQTWGTKGERG